MERVLYQFPISHYCEKARWVLDYKELPYRIYNQLPGPHAFVNRLRTGRTTVPILVEDGKAIRGSHAIALHLEAANASKRLLPETPEARARLDELVRYFDYTVGPAVRRYAYGFITARPELFNQMFYGEYQGAWRKIGQLMSAPIRMTIAKMYDVKSASARGIPDTLRAAADQIERDLENGSGYLLEGRFTLADVTVASLLGPMIGPPGSPWNVDLPVQELQSLRAELSARPVGRYITRIYASRNAAPTSSRKAS
jgi:glutathione S-transferase